MSSRMREFYHKCAYEECMCQIELTEEFECACERYFCHIHKRRYIDAFGYVCDDCGDDTDNAGGDLTDVDD